MRSTGRGLVTRSIFGLVAASILHFGCIHEVYAIDMFDTWAYYVDEHRWEKLLDEGPGGHGYFRTATYDPLHHRMIYQEHALNLEKGAEEWTEITDIPGNFIVGPYFSPERNTLYRERSLPEGGYGLNAWNLETNIFSTIPIQNWAWTGYVGSHAVDDERDRLIGFGRGRLITYDLAESPSAAQQLPLLGDVPETQDFHQAVIDVKRDRMIIFGGKSGDPSNFASGYKDDTFELNLETDTWTMIDSNQSPPPRGQYAYAWDAEKQRMYVLCGLYRTGFDFSTVATYNEIWVYDSKSQSWSQEIPVPGDMPAIRRQPSAVFDPINRRIVMTAGESLGVTPPSRSVLKLPKSDRKISGNSVTVMAELSIGKPQETRSVLFEYRLPSNTGIWKRIIPSGEDESNPDTRHPYFIHWDVSSLPEGPVDLRAVATSDGGVIDPGAEIITVYIDYDDAVSNETQVADGGIVLTYKTGAGYGEAGSATTGNPGNIRVRHEPETFSAGTDISVSFPSVAEIGSMDVLKTNLVAEVTVNTSPSLPVEPLTLVFNYPDTDNDGIVDGSMIPENRLMIYSKGESGVMTPLSNILIDKELNQVRGETLETGMFIVASDIPTSITAEMIKNHLLGTQLLGQEDVHPADGNLDASIDAADLKIKVGAP